MASRALTAASAVAASTTLAASVSLPAYRALPGPFPTAVCTPTLADASGAAWQFNLTSIAGANLTYTTSGGKYTFTTSPCGIPPSPCVPAQHSVGWPYASVTQFFPGSSSGGQCYNPATGGVQACSDDCEPAGTGVAQWSLMDASNAGAGLQGVFSGMFTQRGDASVCQWDPVTGTPQPRTSVVQISCNAGMPDGEVNVTGQFEYPTCNYVMQLESAAACPVGVNSTSPLPPPSSPPLPSAAGTGPFAPYLCQPVLSDASGKQFGFNFSGLYAPGRDYTATDANNVSYTWQVCGISSAVCTPTYAVRFNNGPAVVTYPVTTRPALDCYFANGTAAPCTNDCLTPGWSTPVYTLIDGGNGATGGVALTYPGVDVLPDDPRPCPTDPGSGQEQPAQFVLNMQCDASVPANTLKVLSAGVSAPCVFSVTASTAAACGNAAVGV